MDSFNIVDLIENNPITKLSTTYQNKLLTKIKAKFTESEQQLFVVNFYGVLKYDTTSDFVIDLDDVWKWLEFSTKQKAKMLLENHFVKDKDYKISATPQVKQTDHARGGHNKETFLLNITTFKKFCLKAGTKKADDIHDYYIKLEQTLQEVSLEESDELKTQLEQQQIQLEKSEKTAEKIREKTLLEQFGRNTQCVYYGSIDNVSDTNEKLLKFGNSNNLVNRVSQHKDTYTNFRLLNAFKVDNKLQVESEMKEHPLFADRQRTITIKSKNYVELLSMKDITFTLLDKTIREIILSNECNPENFKKLLEENKRLNTLIKEHDNFNHMNELIVLRDENKKLKLQNLRIIKKYKKWKSNSIDVTIVPSSDSDNDSNSDSDNNSLVDYSLPHSDSITVTNQEVLDYGIVLNRIRNKRRDRHEDGFFHIDGRLYPILEGTRNEVWECKAYQTAGGLIKTDFLINQHGKIVSKSKCIDGIINNKLDIVNQRRRDRIKAHTAESASL
jgi:phage anti-repressor protein